MNYGNFKSIFFSFTPYSLLMFEGGWLKMSHKRNLRELKAGDEEKSLFENSVRKST